MRDAGLDGIGAEIVTRLRVRRSEIVQAIYARIQESVPDSVGGGEDDPAYQAGVLAAVTGILGYCLEAVEHGDEWSGSVPPEAVAQAHRAARAGVNSGTVLRRYVAAHGRLGEFVAEEAGHIGLSSNGSALHHLRRTQEMLLERVTAVIEREYDEECERMTRPPEQRRTEIVTSLLADEPVELSELTALEYEFHTSWHLGVIAAGPGIQTALRRVKADLGYQLLQASCGDGRIWAWLGAPRGLKVMDVERLLAASGTTGEAVAIGGLGRGLPGWRQTHREAEGALLQALRRPEKAVRYADTPLLVAALENATLATWLRELLTPIRSRPDGGADLLQTLRAYIDAECNGSCAASALKVRRQTVGNRLRLVEKLLGRPLHTCLAEVDIALRLVDLIPDDPSFTR
jgi:PucR C-terminal helix-turn-helix domain